MALRQFGAAAAAAVTLALAASPAHAVIEIQWWHAMTGANNDVVNRLAEEFNASQSDYKVVPSYKGSYPDTMRVEIRKLQRRLSTTSIYVTHDQLEAMTLADILVVMAMSPGKK